MTRESVDVDVGSLESTVTILGGFELVVAAIQSRGIAITQPIDPAGISLFSADHSFVQGIVITALSLWDS